MSKTHLGHTARKRFGQNFLHDDYVIGKIVAAIAPKNEQNLVEIGPGLGALTDPVCEEVDALTVIELDRDLAKRLKGEKANGILAKGTKKGLLLNVTSGNVIRLLPPLTLTEEEADLIVEGVMELIHELNE